MKILHVMKVLEGMNDDFKVRLVMGDEAFLWVVLPLLWLPIKANFIQSTPDMVFDGKISRV